jgi:site-specific recombinase XerD
VPAGARLFPITRQHFYVVFRKHCAGAGIPEHLAFPHALKHSSAMELTGKITLQELQLHLGRKSLASTAQYLRPSEQQAAISVLGAMNF